MKILNVAGVILLAVVAWLAALAPLAPRFGWHLDTVVSNSMAPAMSVGSLAVTCQVESASIKPCDIITFYSPDNGKLISHRVVQVVNDSLISFHTKGDANEDPDQVYVPATNVIGKVVFHLPYIGYLVQFLKSRWGMLVFLIPGLAVIFMELRNIWFEIQAILIERRARISP